MYIINNFVYGHKMAEHKELNNELWQFELEFRKVINGKRYEVDFPYHGGQIRGDVISVIFGTVITDDDGNSDYSKEIRLAKEEDYEKEYQIFLEAYIEDLNANKGEESDYDQFVEKLIPFLRATKPDFYTVESSS
jgi:hypothetical protein